MGKKQNRMYWKAKRKLHHLWANHRGLELFQNFPNSHSIGTEGENNPSQLCKLKARCIGLQIHTNCPNTAVGYSPPWTRLRKLLPSYSPSPSILKGQENGLVPRAALEKPDSHLFSQLSHCISLCHLGSTGCRSCIQYLNPQTPLCYMDKATLRWLKPLAQDHTTSAPPKPFHFVMTEKTSKDYLQMKFKRGKNRRGTTKGDKNSS